MNIFFSRFSLWVGKPGEIMEGDWAGSTFLIIDMDTGEKIKAYVESLSIELKKQAAKKDEITSQGLKSQSFWGTI